MAVTIAQATQALNTTLSQLGYDYQLPTTGTDAEILQAFQNVGAFSPDAKSNILMRQQIILVQNIFDSRFNESKNPTRVFWRNDVNYGGGIQDTFIELIEAESGYWLDQYTGTTATDNALAQEIMTDLVKAKLDNVKTKIHTINQKFRLKLTVSDLEVSKVFTPQGYASFLETKYANLANSVEAHFMDIVINQMKDMILNSRTVFKLGYDLNTSDGVTTFVEALNTVSDGMQTLNSGYNVEAVRTTSNFNDLYLVVTPDIYNRIKSRGYANAFNLQEYENKNRLIMLPAGTNLGNGSDGKQIGAMLVDRRAVLFSLRYWSTKPFIVSNTDYTNTFVNIQGISGDTGFFQSVAFGTGAVGNFTEANALSDKVWLAVQRRPSGTNIVVTVNGIDSQELTPFATMQFANSFAQYYYIDKNSILKCDTSVQAFYDPAFYVVSNIGNAAASCVISTGVNKEFIAFSNVYVGAGVD